MKNLTVIPKKGLPAQEFENIKSESLATLIEAANSRGLSLEEVENIAEVKNGVILEALESNDVLAPMDAFNFIEKFL